jgi:WD40 repeat protein
MVSIANNKLGSGSRVRIFLSFNSKDLALAEAMRGELSRLDPGIDIFFSPASLGSGFWVPIIDKEIAEADGFLLLIGPKGIGPWQEIEYFTALDRHVKDRQFPLLPVIAEDAQAPGLSFLRTLNCIEVPVLTQENTLRRVLSGLGGEEPQAPAPLWKLVNPYRGLEAMTEANSDYFYGRGGETATVLQTLADKPDRLPILIGASGVGKSSVAQAGVLSAIKSMRWPEVDGAAKSWPAALQNSRAWVSLTVRIGDAPLETLVRMFVGLWGLDARDPYHAGLHRKWAEGLRVGHNELTDLLNATQSELKKQQGEAPERFLIYLDQGEELYTRSPPNDARRFAEILAEGVRDRRLLAFASLRADYFDKLQADEPLFKCHEHVNVLPLNLDQLGAVVTGPARALAVRFENDEIARLIINAASAAPGALPLLSYLLTDMWREMLRRGEPTLRLPAHAIDIGGALASRAEMFLEDNPEQETVLRRLLTLRLAIVPPEGEPVRRQADQGECTEHEWALAARLADSTYRLVVISEREADGRIVAEVAHDAFLRSWPRLAQWFREERDFLVFKGDVERNERRWRDMRQSNRALLTGLDLSRAEEWSLKRSTDFSDEVRVYMQRSISSDRATKKRQAWFKISTIGAAVVIPMIALIAYFYSVQASLKAREARYEADTIMTSGLRPEQSRISNLRAAIQAYTGGLGGYGAVWASLQQIYELYRFDATDKDVSGQFHAADFSADSKSIFAIDLGGKLHQWALAPGHKALREFVIGPRDASGRPAEGRSLRVSPQGDVAAVGFNDGSVVLVELNVNEIKTNPLHINGINPHSPLIGSGAASVFGVVFSSDGSLLVTASRAGNVVIWERYPPVELGTNARNGSLSWRLNKNIHLDNLAPADIWAVDIDRAKGIIAVGLGDGRVCLLWLDEPDETKCSPKGHKKTVKSVKFMPDKPILVSAGNDAKITIWDLDVLGRSLNPWPTALSQDNAIWDIDFNRDGSLLATSSWDGSIRLYQTANWRILNTVAADKVGVVLRAGKEDDDQEDTSLAVRTVRFDSTSSMLVTASLDHTVRVWTPLFDRTSVLDLSYRFVPIGDNSARVIRSVAIGPIGNRIAFTDGERVYLRSSGEAPSLLPLAAGGRPAVSRFSQVLMPSENEVVASSVEPRLAIWSKSGSEWLPRTLSLPGDAIMAGRSLAIDDARSTLAVEVRDGERAGIVLCSIRGKSDEWICTNADRATAERLSLAVDLKRSGCAYEQQLSITLSKTARLIAAGAGYCPIEILDRRNLNGTRRLSVTGDFNFTSLDFSPDERALVATSSGIPAPEVRIWDLADGRSRNINHHFSPTITAARYSPSGQWIISASYDNTIVVSSAKTGNKLIGLNYSNGLTALDIASTPRGTLMAIGSESGDVIVTRFFENSQEITSYTMSVLQDISQ